IKVLYIAGWGRSGSTILDNILAQVGGFWSIGEFADFAAEFYDVTNKGRSRLCGCRARVDECGFWQNVLTRAFGKMPTADDWKRIYTHARKVGRIRYSPLIGSSLGKKLIAQRVTTFSAMLGRLYMAVKAVTGADVIVDSSKTASHGEMLLASGVCQLYVVHLIRDPRACAYSWQRMKSDGNGPGTHMGREGILKSTAMCVATHIAIEQMLAKKAERYMKIRYEDFIERPRRTVEAILEMLDVSQPAPFVSDNAVQLRPVHCLSGNPSRFKQGVVTLTKDEEWRAKMTSFDRLKATAVSLPLLWKYGYDTLS
ncbi:MAG: sulfotransferase, partial [Deltaproteobacteria bacterium]|nr:sulfotransferase [Deltaproteobacteria bacterium]